MTIPSGTGTEVLKRCNLVAVTSGTAWAVDFAGAIVTSAATSAAVGTNHIITIISVIICNTVNTVETLNMYLESGGSNNCSLLIDYPLSGKEVFTWNEKLVLHPTDQLLFSGSSGSNFDVWVSFIDQNWV